MAKISYHYFFRNITISRFFVMLILQFCLSSVAKIISLFRALECNLVASSHSRKKTKVSATQKVSLLFNNRNVRLISWSKPIKDSEGRTPPLIGRGPDIPVRVCTFEDACAAAVRQREIEVSSRDAWSSFSESALFSERLTVPPGFCDR